MSARKRGADDAVNLDRVKGATSVLVLAPEMEEPVDRVCHALLTPDYPAETGIIKISYHFSPAEIADRWRQRNPDSPAKLYCLSVSDSTVDKPGSYGEEFLFESARAGDLTGTGMKLNEIIGGINTDTSTTLVCLDSLDSMLMYNDKQTVYRFIRTISNFLSANNAQIHFHLDPAQHADVVNTLKSAFNAVVEVGEEGIDNIKTR